MLADRFADAARERDLDVVARAHWNPQASSFDRLARRVAARRPDAIFLGGVLDTRGADVVRALRRRTGEDVLVLTPSGFTPTPTFADSAGPAAEGVYVSLPGVLTETLGPAGRSFVERFGATQPGADVEPSALYAAESMAVALDAIAASDGTREDVVKHLFTTHRPRSLLGDLSFDRNGEPRTAPVTVLRIRRGAPRLADLPDAVIDRVVE
jgi:ABC-type branched-subunit amino acid transport system substrate-binding protein